MNLINYDDDGLIYTNNQLSPELFNGLDIFGEQIYSQFDFSQILSAKEASLVNDFDNMNMNNMNQNSPTMNTLNTTGNDDDNDGGGLSHEDASIQPTQITLPPTTSQCKRLQKFQQQKTEFKFYLKLYFLIIKACQVVYLYSNSVDLSTTTTTTQFDSSQSVSENDEISSSIEVRPTTSRVAAVSGDELERRRERNRLAARRHIDKRKRQNVEIEKCLKQLRQENLELNEKMKRVAGNIDTLNRILFSIISK